MKPKKSNKEFYIFMTFVAFLFMAFFSLHYGKIYYGNVSGQYATMLGGETERINIFTAFSLALQHVNEKPFDIFPINPKTLLVTLVFLGFTAYVTLYLIFVEERNAHTANGIENGSAKWNDGKRYLKKYVDKVLDGHIDKNMVLSNEVKLSMNGRKTRKNNNTLIVGGAGQGKTRFVLKPNLLQMNASFITTDPSGDIMSETGLALSANGYILKLFSTSDMARSNHYNPFDYVRDENGEVDSTKVDSMVYAFIKNGNEMGSKSSDPFWEKSAKAFISSIVFYLLEEKDRSHQNFYHVLLMTQSAAPEENAKTSSSPLDPLFRDLEHKKPNSRAVSNFKTFKLAGAKTMSSILISAAVDLNIFGEPAVRALTSTNLEDPERNLLLAELGSRKTALFINIPQADGTYNFLVSMMYTQLFSSLYTKAEKISTNSFHLFDSNGWVLKSMIPSKEEAEEFKKLYKDATYSVGFRDDREFITFTSGDQVLKEFEILHSGDKKADEENRKIMMKRADVDLAAMKRAKVKRGTIMLPCPVRCLMDEFANVGKVPSFPELLATMRRYNISCTIILQNLSQLKNMYDKLWEGIIGTCSSFIFLGSSELETCEYVSKMLGKTTIVVRNNSRTMSSKSGSSGLTYNRSARDLMDVSEVRLLESEVYSIVFVDGQNPFYTPKFLYEKHKFYKMTGDFNQKFILDKKYLTENFYITSFEKKEANKIKSQANAIERLESANNNKTIDNEEMFSKPENIKSVNDLVDTVRSSIPRSDKMSKEEVIGKLKDNGKKDSLLESSSTLLEGAESFIF